MAEESAAVAVVSGPSDLMPPATPVISAPSEVSAGTEAVATVAPQQGEFTYRAGGDGEYWFSIVRIDRDGKATPPSLEAEPPNLIVVVDTQPPEVEVEAENDRWTFEYVPVVVVRPLVVPQFRLSEFALPFAGMIG